MTPALSSGDEDEHGSLVMDGTRTVLPTCGLIMAMSDERDRATTWPISTRRNGARKFRTTVDILMYAVLEILPTEDNYFPFFSQQLYPVSPILKKFYYLPNVIVEVTQKIKI